MVLFQLLVRRVGEAHVNTVISAPIQVSAIVALCSSPGKSPPQKKKKKKKNPPHFIYG